MKPIMKKVTAFAIGTLLFASLVSAADNMAVMNYQAVLFSGAAADDASVELRSRLEGAQARLRELETGLQTRQSRLQTDADILTDQETQTFRQEMQAMLAERQQITAQVQQAQQTSRNEFAQLYQPVIREIVARYVEENSIGTILDAQAVVWNDSLPDITDDITALFDEQYNASKE